MAYLPGMLDTIGAISRLPSMTPPQAAPVSGFGSTVVKPEYQAFSSTGYGGGFGGFMPRYKGSGGGGIDARAAALADAERKAALGLLEGGVDDINADPMRQAAAKYYTSVLGGSALPYSNTEKDRLYSTATDEIGAAQNAARMAAERRAASMGLGRGSALASQLRASEGQAALARQGARTGIENTAVMANQAARQAAASGAGGLFGTTQSLMNPLRSQAANIRVNTQFRGGAGGGGLGTARSGKPMTLAQKRSKGRRGSNIAGRGLGFTRTGVGTFGPIGGMF